uniref:CPG4 domain-containing protein n=1 Tax=Globodera rostochiensis TaxID=31243 RepID=A0A914H5I3_GLORO
MSLTTSHSVLLLSPVFQLINHLFLITILFPLVVVISVSVLENEHNCDGNCIQEMERLIEATPSSTGIGVSPFLYSAEHNFMSQFFSRVCDAYRGVDECMVRCESRSKQVSDLKAAYSGLQFVCKEQREEFFGSLPCLSENESKGVQRCSAQINQSHITTVLFTNSIISREFHSMQLRFSSLCRDLATVVRCMIPVIKESCGEQPANLLLKFIGLEFSSFELLYRQLGFDAPLPASCRALITFALANDRAQKPKTRVLLTKLHNNFYLDDHQNNLNGFPSFSDQWKLINQIIFVVVLHSIRIHYLI